LECFQIETHHVQSFSPNQGRGACGPLNDFGGKRSLSGAKKSNSLTCCHIEEETGGAMADNEASGLTHKSVGRKTRAKIRKEIRALIMGILEAIAPAFCALENSHGTGQC
jgi:hypothetical protein